MTRQLHRSEIHSQASYRSVVVIAAISIALQACGGGGGDGDGDGATAANGLLPGLEPCAYLLDVGVPVDVINDGGSCIFTQEDGSTGFASVGEDPVDGDPLNPDIPGSGVPINDDPEVIISNPELLSGDVPRNPALADVEGSAFFPNPNNSAILSGPVVGDSSVDNSLLTRSLPFDIESMPPELSVEHVYAVREDDEGIDVIAIVRNVSSEAQCFVDTSDMFILDQSGNRVDPVLALAFVDGNSYQLTSSIITNTCLDAGQLGYMKEDFDIDLTDVQAVNVGSVDLSRVSSFTKSATQVLPVSYEALPNGDFEILVVNQGLITVQLGFTRIYMLDNDGFVLGSDATSSSETLDPGAEAVIRFDAAQFQGSATSIRVIVDWNLPE